jgi:hypothetical protein
LYFSTNAIGKIKSRRMRLARHVANMGEKRNAYRVLVGKPKGKGPLERPGRRWVDNIKMDLRGIRWGNMDWIDLTRDGAEWWAVVNMVMNHRLP